MKTKRFWVLLMAALLPTGTFAADMLYKSVDDQGRVTYSSHPPEDAVETKGVQVAPGPSAQAAEEARERASAMEQEAQAQYEELMERRRQEAEVRKEAERERVAKETAERQRRIDESLQRLSNERHYLRPYPHDWHWPYRPHPPMYPPLPPRPVHPVAPPNQPYEDHINPPMRNR